MKTATALGRGVLAADRPARWLTDPLVLAGATVAAPPVELPVAPGLVVVAGDEPPVDGTVPDPATGGGALAEPAGLDVEAGVPPAVLDEAVPGVGVEAVAEPPVADGGDAVPVVPAEAVEDALSALATM